jgi:hypothetical protein
MSILKEREHVLDARIEVNRKHLNTDCLFKQGPLLFRLALDFVTGSSDNVRLQQLPQYRSVLIPCAHAVM